MKINYKEKTLIQGENQKEVEFLVEDQKLQLQSDVLATKRDLAAAKMQLDDLKTDYPLDIDAIIATQLKIEALEDGLIRLSKLQKELNL